MYTIAVMSGKGGVAKTTTAVAIAAGCAAAGLRTVLVDFDPSGSATRAAGIDPLALRPSATVLGLLDDVPLTPAQAGEGFGVLSGAPKAEGLAAEIRAAVGRLAELRADLIVIDTPPGFGALPQSAVKVADAILTPIELEPMSVETLAAVDGLLGALGARSNWLGILPTKVSPRLALSQLQLKTLEEYGVRVFDGIPRSVGVAEARLAARSILSYAPKSASAKAYKKLCDELAALVRKDASTSQAVARG